MAHEQVFARVRDTPGHVFDRPGYHADADQVEAQTPNGVIWKLERAQFFNELGDPAWEAFQAGNWPRVQEIFESERDAIQAELHARAQLGQEFRRLRIVEHPPTPYLQWESHSHRVFVECGHAIRTLDATRVAGLEQRQPLPELMVFGDQTLYQVRYDQEWTPIGAKRIDDPTLVRDATAAIVELWVQAEPFVDYFDREIAPLPMPTLMSDRV